MGILRRCAPQNDRYLTDNGRGDAPPGTLYGRQGYGHRKSGGSLHKTTTAITKQAAAEVRQLLYSLFNCGTTETSPLSAFPKERKSETRLFGRSWIRTLIFFYLFPETVIYYDRLNANAVLPHLILYDLQKFFAGFRDII